MRSTMPFAIQQLDASTWDVFAELVERNNGVYGGCWCIGYHPECTIPASPLLAEKRTMSLPPAAPAPH